MYGIDNIAICFGVYPLNKADGIFGGRSDISILDQSRFAESNAVGVFGVLAAPVAAAKLPPGTDVGSGCDLSCE